MKRTVPKKAAGQSPSPQVSPAPTLGLIAKGHAPRRSVGAKPALDDLSHRTVKGQSFPDDWLPSRPNRTEPQCGNLGVHDMRKFGCTCTRWWFVERDPTNKPALLPHTPQRSRAAGADFTRLYVRSGQELGTKEVAHSCYGDTAYAAEPSGCIGRTSDRSC